MPTYILVTGPLTAEFTDKLNQWAGQGYRIVSSGLYYGSSLWAIMEKCGD